MLVVITIFSAKKGKGRTGPVDSANDAGMMYGGDESSHHSGDSFDGGDSGGDGGGE